MKTLAEEFDDFIAKVKKADAYDDEAVDVMRQTFFGGAYVVLVICKENNVDHLRRLAQDPLGEFPRGLVRTFLEDYLNVAPDKTAITLAMLGVAHTCLILKNLDQRAMEISIEQVGQIFPQFMQRTHPREEGHG